ncbi:MAG: DEAD/DEAH box helicase [Chroococcidiopsidaceae cyanobacterium CP_BM_ER_R8_30]|nr:DEAD/DEAH box helicase [Chroococcidiopsidaceae cyanobacterium CP_BM_ER_R8_30]
MAEKRKDSRQKQIQRIAQETFGYDCLSPGQQEIIQPVVDGRDTLAIMPTGSGKSALYQIAALLLPGTTIVISPLIALQYDQIEAITEYDLASVAAVNSTIPDLERQEALENLEQKELEFVFLAPEQFNNEEVLAKVRAAYQEIGRAERDGKEALATLFYCPDDLKLRRFFAGGG